MLQRTVTPMLWLPSTAPPTCAARDATSSSLSAKCAMTCRSGRAGGFPSANDPEFDLAPEAKAFQTNHELPFLLRELGPLNARLGLPFSLTALSSEHGNRVIILLIPLLGVLLPFVRLAPAVYNWAGRRRLLYWYRRLKMLERQLLNDPNTDPGISTRELEIIDEAVARIHVPLAFSSQLYDLRLHINLVRDRLSPQLARVQPPQ
jgi:hypothetical protein